MKEMERDIDELEINHENMNNHLEGKEVELKQIKI